MDKKWLLEATVAAIVLVAVGTQALAANPKRLHVHMVGGNETVEYAATELARCLKLMTGVRVDIDKLSICACASKDDCGICVGLMSAFPGVRQPKVADPKWDDAIAIDVKGGSGYISGNNPRSVLIAVYRYLTEQGCQWVRPGLDGEYVPKVEALMAVKLTDVPSYRHRGICIEGAISYEHLKNTIDWMPKVGFNEYFIQFRDSYTFFERWYNHTHNPLMARTGFDERKAASLTNMAIDEIKKRGLVYQGVGHGWTCEALGIRGLGWDPVDDAKVVPPGADQYFALVNGERKLWGHVTINTSLCYSNPKVRNLVTSEIVDYSKKHPKLDIIHFWLADGSNNNCECENCRKARPSDFYIMMLNELDAKLRASNLGTRIVFLAYADLLWPPETQRIANPDRFIMMFAPITRSYSSTYTPLADEPALPMYLRNKLELPRDLRGNLAFLKAWQKQFNGDSFDFDYHMIWDHYHDPGYMDVARTLSGDIKALREIGLDGFVSCQAQRVFFPTGLPMTVMGRTLWNRDLSFDEIASDYFMGAYGPDGDKCRAYLEQITRLFDPVYMRGEKQPVVSPEAAANFAKASQVVDEFMPTIDRNVRAQAGCWQKSWFYMRQHAELCKQLAAAFECRARGEQAEAARRWAAARRWVHIKEPVIQHVFDPCFFFPVMDPKMAAN